MNTLHTITGPDFKFDNTQEPMQLTVETPTVDKMLAKFNSQWELTANACIARAEQLETAAFDLRERAQKLRDALVLTDEVKGAVLYEIEARHRAEALALV